MLCCLLNGRYKGTDFKNSFKQEGSMVQPENVYHFTKSFAHYGQANSCQPWKALNSLVHT